MTRAEGYMYISLIDPPSADGDVFMQLVAGVECSRLADFSGPDCHVSMSYKMEATNSFGHLIYMKLI